MSVLHKNMKTSIFINTVDVLNYLNETVPEKLGVPPERISISLEYASSEDDMCSYFKGVRINILPENTA